MPGRTGHGSQGWDMLIPMLTFSVERDSGSAPVSEDNTPRPRFAHFLEQCSTPPFAPWPQAVGDIKTPVATPPSQITQPADRGRRQGQRRGRG